MGVWIYIILATAALITSTISAILGTGGGILLLATLLCFMTHGEAIPTHAAVQIASNGTRVLAFLKNVDGRALCRFLLGMVPGAGIGFTFLWWLGEPQRSEPYLKTLIGAYILVMVTLPQRRKNRPSAGDGWAYTGIGLVAGTAALTVGAVGPLIAPVLARRQLVKERFIATKAVCQLSTHLLKIPAFVALRHLDLSKLGLWASIMILMVIPGTLLGKRVLKGISEKQFRVGFRVALALAGFKVLLFDGLRNIPIQSLWASGSSTII